MDRERVIADVRALLETEAGEVSAAYVFGSVGRGTAGPASDVDIGVLFAQDPPPTLEATPLRLEGRLERLLGAAVQVVSLNGAPPDLVHRVLRDGVLVLDRNPSVRIAFEVRARREFFDVEPYLLEYRRPRARP